MKQFGKWKTKNINWRNKLKYPFCCKSKKKYFCGGEEKKGFVGCCSLDCHEWWGVVSLGGSSGLPTDGWFHLYVGPNCFPPSLWYRRVAGKNVLSLQLWRRGRETLLLCAVMAAKLKMQLLEGLMSCAHPPAISIEPAATQIGSPFLRLFGDSDYFKWWHYSQGIGYADHYPCVI